MVRNNLFSLGKVSIHWISLKILVEILNVVATIAIINCIAFVINSAIQKNFTQDWLLIISIIIVSALLGKIIFSWLSSKAAFQISSKVKIATRNRIYTKLLELEAGYLEVKKTGGIVTTIIEGVESLEVFFGLFFPQIFLSFLIPIGLFIYLWFFSHSIALILVLAVPLIPLSIGVLRVWIRKVSKIHWSTYEDLNSYFLDSVQGITDLKIFGMIDERTKEISKRSWDFRNKTMKLLFTNLTSILAMDLIAMVGTALGITLAVFQLQTGKIALIGAIVILFTSYEFFRPLRQLGSYFHFAVNGISASKTIFEILNQESKQSPNQQFQDLSLKGNYDIKFSDVNFSYDHRFQVLKGISFVVKTGQITAIVGRSGIGKTTIVNLIVRLFDTNSGKIFIGDYDLNNIDPNKIRNLISMVSQHTYLFQGTIRENLLIAKLDATDEELLLACQKAGIIAFVNSLPKKLDTSIAEHAKNFSSGQIQRFAIARALLKNAPILILDEPTSNVDFKSEYEILKTLQEISKEKTTIIISHRLSTIKNVDKILVIDDGLVIEEGTHRELMAANNLYFNLVQSQLKFESLQVKEEMIGVK